MSLGVIERFTAAALRQRVFVLVCVIALVATGLYAWRDRALAGSDHDLAIMLGKRLLRAVIRDPYGESLQLGTIGGFALLQSNAACDGLASALLESSRRKNKHVPPANPPAMLFGAHVLLTESAAGRHDHDDTVRVVRELRLAHESAGGQSAEIFDELLAWHTN